LDTVRGKWQEQKACSVDTHRYFFNYREAAVAKAKAICGGCPVKDECLDHAMNEPEEHGLWGGLTESERVSLSRRATPTSGSRPLELVTYTTRARSTGSTCSAGKTDSGWGVLCETHHTTAEAHNRTAAEYAVSRPEEWCEGCSVV
jgi:WhiB family redox-sensing transcriptional regulator